MKDRDIFIAALQKDPLERPAFLDRACGTDHVLRRHIEGLFQVREKAGSFLESPPVALSPTVDEPATEAPGTVIGPYKLLEQIGEGGMGIVFMAEQSRPLRRKVAVKVIKPGMDTKQVIARFEAERQALAMMDHPNIAKIFDAGTNGNTNPQDIVTDGTSFWVVDGTALKVFKYSLSGSSLGSWTIDAANKNPTGITINPNNVSDIWIVDNGTLKVYQYVGAATRTSGSQSAAATFTLNPNDTNPQGIADPPPASDLLPPTPMRAAVFSPAIVPARPAVAPGLSATATGRDAFFALLDNAPTSGTVSQIARGTASNPALVNLPPSPQAATIPAARIDAVFAGSQQDADEMLDDVPLFPDPDSAELIAADSAG